MNSLIRTIVPARMAVRSLMVPARRMMATQPPPNQSKEEGKNTKEESKDIEKNPKNTEPGSKHALSSEDFGDEASYQNFGNEKVQDANKAWPK